MADNLFAYTAPGGSFPEYVSLNVRAGDVLELTVRSPPSHGVSCHVHEGATATIVIPENEAYDLALGLLNWLVHGARARLEAVQPLNEAGLVAAMAAPAGDVHRSGHEHDTLAAGCCSASRPCGHQRSNPDTICHVCAQAHAQT